LLVGIVSAGCGFSVSPAATSPTDAATTVDGATPIADSRSPMVGPEIPVTSADVIRSRLPSLVWTGAQFGLAWQDERDGNEELYFARLDVHGVKQGADVRVTNDGAPSVDPSLAWTGSGFGVAWCDDRDGNLEIYFARLNAAGVKQGTDVRVTNDGQNSERPAVAWSGSEFVIAWQDERDGNKEIYVARLSATGTKQGADIRLTNDVQRSERPSLIWTGTQLAVAWQDERDANKEIYLARLDALGVKQGADLRVTTHVSSSERPSIASTGTALAIAWQDDRNGTKEFYFTRLTQAGAEIGDDVRITMNGANAQEVSLVWTGAEFAATWTDDRDGNDEIYVATRGSSGEPRAGDVRTTNDPATSDGSSLAGEGTTLGVAWTDARSGTEEVFFQTVSL